MFVCVRLIFPLARFFYPVLVWFECMFPTSKNLQTNHSPHGCALLSPPSPPLPFLAHPTPFRISMHTVRSPGTRRKTPNFPIILFSSQILVHLGVWVKSLSNLSGFFPPAVTDHFWTSWSNKLSFLVSLIYSRTHPVLLVHFSCFWSILFFYCFICIWFSGRSKIHSRDSNSPVFVVVTTLIFNYDWQSLEIYASLQFIRSR